MASASQLCATDLAVSTERKALDMVRDADSFLCQLPLQAVCFCVIFCAPATTRTRRALVVVPRASRMLVVTL